MRHAMSTILLGVLLVFPAGCSRDSESDDVLMGGDSAVQEDEGGGTPPGEEPSASGVDYLPLVAGTTSHYEGVTGEGVERGDVLVSHATREVLGVESSVVVDRRFLDGEIVEETLSLLARDENGTVLKMGEEFTSYTAGVPTIVSEWQAGTDGAEPAVFLTREPKVGDVHVDPNGAGALVEVLAIDASVILPDGAAHDCLKTREVSATRPDEPLVRYYAPNVGLVREEYEDGALRVELDTQVLDAAPIIDPADFVSVIDNPLLSYIPGTTYVYRGSSEDGEVLIEEQVTEETKQILGVTCTVVQVREYLNGQMTEHTADWYAQDIRGNVWYMGEAVLDYENGVLVGSDGSWEAGVDGAMPGIVMKADPWVGDSYRVEYAPGVAMDLVEIVGKDVLVVLGDGTAHSCLKTREWSPYDPEEIEYKYYAPGTGLVKESLVDGSAPVERTDTVTD